MQTQKPSERIEPKYHADNFLFRIFEAMTPEQRAIISATLKGNAEAVEVKATK